MLNVGSSTAIFACTTPVDFRKQHDGLVAIVRGQLGADPLDGSLFVFFNRRRDRVKLLAWDGNGFWLFYKRLETGSFENLRTSGAKRLSLSRAELSMLLDGIEQGKMRANFTDVVRIDGCAGGREESNGRAAAE